MPAAAVIPALLAYTKVVAVKKLVVEGWECGAVLREERTETHFFCLWSGMSFTGRVGTQDGYFEEIGVLKAGACSNSSAWNNEIGR